MKAVLDTSPVIWLNKINSLDLLAQTYEGIYTTPEVKREIKTFPAISLDFIDQLNIPSDLMTDEKRFNKLVRRWMRKLKLQDRADIEVLIAYKFFAGDADEMLFANKDAEFKLGPYGSVRDLANFYEVAESRSIFSRADSITYLEKLAHEGYRRSYVLELIKDLSR
jgi:hypothetical protein